MTFYEMLWWGSSGLSAIWMTWLWWKQRKLVKTVDRIVEVLGQAGPELKRRIVESPESTAVVIPDRWDNSDQEAFEDVV